MAVESGGLSYGNVPLELFLSGSVTFGHGGDPSYADLLYVPFANVAPTGTLVIFDGFKLLSLPQCRLADISYEIDDAGYQRMRIVVEDRRWKWRFGWIQGRYNVPDTKGGKPAREKKPSELIALCMEAMGETSYVTKGVPADVRPFVEWDQPPLEALLTLCESLQLRLFLDVNTNKATIAPVHQGALLPINARLISPSLSVKPPLVPSSMHFLGAPIEWQYDLELESVMQDTDGKFLEPDKVSYKPKDGWGKEPLDCPNVDPKYRELAKQWLWRGYRPSVPIQKSKLPDGADAIAELDRILPLHDQQCEKEVIEPGSEPQPKPAQLFGTWDNANDLASEKTKTVETSHGKMAVWDRGWSLDTERGVIQTGEPAYRRVLDSNPSVTQVNPLDPNQLAAGKLYLRTAISVRDKVTGAFRRSQYDWAPPGTKMSAQPFVLARDDVAIIYIWDQKKKKWIDNLKAFEAEAGFYLAQEAQQFQVTNQATAVYAGMQLQALDGAVHQVTYTVDDAGFMTTSLSRSRENYLVRQTYAERRRQEAVRAILEKERRGAKRRRRA